MIEGNIPPAEGVQPSQEKVSANTPRVVIFEDDPQVAKLMRMSLTGKAEITGLYKSAEDVLQRREEGEGYDVPLDIDVVITDLGLQGMDGIEATKIMIAAYTEAGKIPPHFIMVSGSGDSPTVQEKAKEAGVSEVMGKPFSPRVLITNMQTGYERVQQLRNLQE